MATFADDYDDEFDHHSKFTKPTYPPPSNKSEPISLRRKVLSFSTSDRATKRVIAPYVRVIRKGVSPIKYEKEIKDSDEFKFYLKKKPSVLMRNLSAFLSDSMDLATVMHETVQILKSTIKAVGSTLYIVEEAAQQMYQSPRNVMSSRHKVNWKIEEGKTVAQYVACVKEYVMVDDVLGDLRFPDGVGYQDETIKSVISVPVVTPVNECTAVMEFYRNVTQPNFVRDDLQIVIVVTGWMGVAIHQSEQRLAMKKKQELNDYLLDLIRCYFAKGVSLEKLISELANFTKQTLDADRSSFYTINDAKTLEAEVYEEGLTSDGEYKLYHKNLKANFTKGYGVPGLVARTCEIINIPNALGDSRYDRNVDYRAGVIVRSILTAPIMAVNGLLGVIQLTNKKTGVCFTKADENLLETFTLYYALALHHAYLNDDYRKANALSQSYLNLLNVHTAPCPHDLGELMDRYPLEKPQGFDEFSWYITPDLYPIMPQLVYVMLVDIIGESEINARSLLEFILSVRKSYRKTPYHCFEHGFNVCHCMYTVVKRNRKKFNQTEAKALMIAALCHDLDHRGVTNNFLMLKDDVLCQLYEDSYLENHHYLITMMLLKDHKVLEMMSEEELEVFSCDLKQLILATDMAKHFKARKQFTYFCSEASQQKFDWNKEDHKFLGMSVMMTVADLSALCKPFNYAKRSIDLLYKEYYSQGDMEKSMGFMPLTMMDREKQNLVPEDQVQFATIILIPATEILKTILPNTEPLVTGAQSMREIWLEIIQLQGQKCWRQDDSLCDE